MKLLILGASHAQLNAIQRGKKMGIQIIVSDYNENPVGKRYAYQHFLANTFDAEATYQIAKGQHIHGIMTMGTDQPVLTASKVAEKLNLPSFLSVETAFLATNKKAMKAHFRKNHIPSVKYRVVDKGFHENELQDLDFPVVVKPLDSQGQRGIYKLESIKEVREHFDQVLSFSREKEILIESYYKNDEITMSGWVREGKAKLLTVTDRITFEDDKRIGICLSHRFPSRHLKKHGDELKSLTQKIVDAFQIENGPIYFQVFIGEDGLKVNEIACRIGGAYEDMGIPLLTKVDILKMAMDFSLGKKIDYSALDAYDMDLNQQVAYTELFFLEEGRICHMPSIEEMKKVPGLYSFDYYDQSLQSTKKIENASARAGYGIITGINQEDADQNRSLFYERLKIYDEKGRNMVVHF